MYSSWLISYSSSTPPWWTRMQMLLKIGVKLHVSTFVAGSFSIPWQSSRLTPSSAYSKAKVEKQTTISSESRKSENFINWWNWLNYFEFWRSRRRKVRLPSTSESSWRSVWASSASSYSSCPLWCFATLSPACGYSLRPALRVANRLIGLPQEIIIVLDRPTST